MKNLYSLLTRKQERIGDGKKHGIIIQVKKGHGTVKKRKRTALFLLGILAVAGFCRCRQNKAAGRSGARAGSPPGLSASRRLLCQVGKGGRGEPHTLYLPKDDIVSV